MRTDIGQLARLHKELFRRWLEVGKTGFEFCTRGTLASGQLRERAIRLGECGERCLNAGHHAAVELHLLADVPVEGARNKALHALNGRTGHTGRARVHRADAGHLGFGSIPGTYERHEVGKGRAVRRIAIGIARAHAILNFANDCRQLVSVRAGHLLPSAAWVRGSSSR